MFQKANHWNNPKFDTHFPAETTNYNVTLFGCKTGSLIIYHITALTIANQFEPIVYGNSSSNMIIFNSSRLRFANNNHSKNFEAVNAERRKEG